jgi:L-iditol 2-dehydrogenase
MLYAEKGSRFPGRSAGVDGSEEAPDEATPSDLADSDTLPAIPTRPRLSVGHHPRYIGRRPRTRGPRGVSPMIMMQAVMRSGPDVVVGMVPRPAVQNDDDVIVRVALAGICRTDLYVAQGRLGSAPDALILGHEFAGTVEDLGPGCRGLRRGDPVTAFPIVPCGSCVNCTEGYHRDCLRRSMLGVDRDGAFAEYVAVPARCVYRLPAGLSFRSAAYAEPVAAALAVLNAGLHRNQFGLVYGRNRFAALVGRVLRAHGFERVSIFDPADRGDGPPSHAFDFVIETSASAEALAEAVRAARPRGTVVLKSRQPWPASIDLLAAVPKELTFRAVHYGPFDRALTLLAEGRVAIDDLLGPVYPLAEAVAAFAEAGRAEALKVFLDPTVGGHVRDR